MRKYKRWRYYIDGKEVTQQEAEKQMRINLIYLDSVEHYEEPPV